MFCGNFAITGWAMCNGQLMAIQQNAALFSILGTTYGGNGTTTFALPDFRSRAPVHMGQGVGLSNYVLGEETGTETVNLNITQIPQHSHLLSVSNASASVSDPTGAYPAQINDGTPREPDYVNAYGTTPTGTLAATAISTVGGSTPHSNIQPVLAVTFLIALQGIFPSRN